MYQNCNDGFLQSRHQYHQADISGELENLFCKKFMFSFNKDWKLPDHDAWFRDPPWTVKELDTLKSRLNFHKSQLNDFNIEEWSSHTRRRNPAGEVCWKLRNTVDPEFLTQAWTKFYECASNYDTVPEEAVLEGSMVSLHLCEAPGAFITSLNHYLKCIYPNINWQWIASTLNPYYEGNSSANMINDDRFMFHTLQHWDFGVDNTGNLMNWENSQALVERVRKLGKVQLVTADGSIDCLQRPDAQEEVTSPLHYCEIVTALQALTTGGTFIFKLFTMFEHSTVSLFYLLSHLFAEVSVYKPVTSRPGNSEVYAICLGFKGPGVLEPWLPVLIKGFGSELYGRRALLPAAAVPPDFVRQVVACADYFCSLQCHVINDNLQAYLMRDLVHNHAPVKRLRQAVANAFLAHYGIRRLERADEILKGLLRHEDQKVNTNPRYHRGSYSERQSFRFMPPREKCRQLRAFLCKEGAAHQQHYMADGDQRWLAVRDADYKVRPVFTFGKPLIRVNGSKFVFIPIFKLYQQIIAEKDFNDILTKHDVDVSDVFTGPSEYKDVVFPKYDSEEDYFVYEKRCFRQLINYLNELKPDESVFLRNFSLLTHFNVGILYILCKSCFEKVGFDPRSGIMLSSFRNNVNDCFNLIASECAQNSGDCKDVLGVLPVQETNSVEFFNNIVFYNNSLIRNKCMQYLDTIEKEAS